MPERERKTLLGAKKLNQRRWSAEGSLSRFQKDTNILEQNLFTRTNTHVLAHLRAANRVLHSPGQVFHHTVDYPSLKNTHFKLLQTIILLPQTAFSVNL
jgi:hypothetical protein